MRYSIGSIVSLECNSFPFHPVLTRNEKEKKPKRHKQCNKNAGRNTNTRSKRSNVRREAICPPLDNGCTEKNGTTEEGKLCLRLEFNGYNRKNGAMEQRNLCPPLDISLLHNNHVNIQYKRKHKMYWYRLSKTIFRCNFYTLKKVSCHGKKQL